MSKCLIFCLLFLVFFQEWLTLKIAFDIIEQEQYFIDDHLYHK
ncbi:hypothetical protein DAT561_0721 [Melissococcus plutonius]|uniref:Uncharacterized protein n=1 Tax=Melissococcus plutonius TaxID=33970 RepID=A0A2Z5Y247_9ENTE|nr:hypothetical protein DAT561_0721 [Melissococcus plutonius]